MKTTKRELLAVEAVDGKEKAVVAKAVGKTAKVKAEPKDVWAEVAKVVVSTWFGNHSAREGIELAKTFTAPGVLALVCVGQAMRDGDGPASQTELELKLLQTDFRLQEAELLSQEGFRQITSLRLVKRAKGATVGEGVASYTLSQKGERWFELLERNIAIATA